MPVRGQSAVTRTLATLSCLNTPVTLRDCPLVRSFHRFTASQTPINLSGGGLSHKRVGGVIGSHKVDVLADALQAPRMAAPLAIPKQSRERDGGDNVDRTRACCAHDATV